MSSDEEAPMGPVEVLVVEFPGNRFTGDIAPAITELEDAGLVNVLDLVFVSKDAEGKVSWFELGGLPDEIASSFAPLDHGPRELLTEQDIADVAEGLDPETSIGVLVWENVWASRFAKAVRDANGRVLLNERIPRRRGRAGHGRARRRLTGAVTPRHRSASQPAWRVGGCEPRP